ncbi:MAG: AAA family ATPase, partial [Myxococcota bacterium]
ALLHGHLAIQPWAPHEVHPDVPEPLSALVSKLLTKMPEARYQGAAGLRADLEHCRDALREEGWIPPFEPGTHDLPSRLRVSHRLVARDRERALLLDAFGRAGDGAAEMVLVSGWSGVGKSALVEDVRGEMVEAGAAFASGKYNQLQNIPYSALIQACRDLVRGVLGEPEERLARWQDDVQRALGSVGRAVVDVIPELEFLVGPQPALEPLPPAEASNRFQRAFQRFLQVFARPGRPLVIFLDDLHWGDGRSMELLEGLLAAPDSRHVLVVGACRAHEVGPEHPLLELRDTLKAGDHLLTEVRLEPLDRDSVAELVADSLSRPRADVSDLVNLVYARTRGNPFFVGRFLLALQDEGAIRLDAQSTRWTWDLDHIRRMDLPDTVAELMSHRIRRLPEEVRPVLERAAAIGNRFELHTLATVCGLTDDETADRLALAEREELLTRERSSGPTGRPPSYRFLHDRIQAAAYALIPEEERPSLHRHIGRLMKAEAGVTGGDTRLFDVVNHLDLGAGLVTDPEERLALARLNRQAGQRALDSTAYQQARTWLATAMDLLPPDAWDAHHDLAFDVHLGLAQALLMCGEYEEALTVADVAEAHATSNRERVDLSGLRVSTLVRMDEYAAALDAGLDALGMFGVEAPRGSEALQAAIAEEQQGLTEALGDRPVASLLDGPEATDPDIRLEIQLLSGFGTPAHTQPMLFAWINTRIARLSLTYGHTPDSALGYVLYGMLCCMLHADYERGRAFGDLGRALHERQGVAAAEGPIVHLRAAFIDHWHRSYADCKAGLSDALRLGLEHGIYVTVGWAAFNMPWFAFVRGEALPALVDEASALVELARTTLRSGDTENVCLWTMRRALELMGREEDLAELDRSGRGDDAIQDHLAHFTGFTAANHAQALAVAVIRGRTEEALGLVEATEPIALGLAGSVWEVEFVFWSAMARCLAGRGEDDASRARWDAAQDAALERLTGWAERCPANHRWKQLLVEAEIAAARGWERQAAGRFENAVDEAHADAFIHGEALACERAGRFFVGLGWHRTARGLLHDARQAWLRWGAEAHVRDLEEGFPALRRTRATTAPRSLDVDTVIEASEAIAGEMVLDRLVARLIRMVLENAGAQRGMLLLARRGGLYAEARGEAGRETVELLHGVALSECADVPATVIRYVQRTRSSVVSEDASTEATFSGDARIRRAGVHSLLCVPLKQRGELVGVVYLENNLTVGAFTEDRVELVRTLASLAATSLENARLYANLAVATEELRASHAKLEAHSRALEDTVEQRTSELTRLHRKHRLILDSMDEAICGLDDQRRITFANPAAARLCGRSVQELIGRPLGSVLRDPDGSALALRGDGALREGRLRTDDDRELPVEYATRPVPGDPSDRLRAVATFRDITDRRELEEQLRHAQKMEAVGQFAGGVAHDFNNLLTPILGNISLVKLRSGLDEPCRRLLSDAERAGERAAELVKQMLAFSRRSELFMKPTDVVPMIDEVTRFLSRSIDPSIHLEWRPPDELDWVHGDASLLHQVLLNLAVNARDAVQARLRLEPVADPHIRIGAHVETLTEEDAAHHPGARPGRFVVLSVEDNGAGMDAETLERVFEPFFTTKDVGEGTGLGLSVVYGIVKQHEGWVVCDSHRDHGTTFRCYLPARPPVDMGDAARRPSGIDESQGSGRILVVDDDDLVRQLGRSLLMRFGYEVVEARNGREAVDRYRAEGDSIDLVLLDLSMPVMSGKEALRELRAMDPDVRVVLWSGYSMAEESETLQGLGACGFVAKPFHPSALAEAVQSALQRRAEH